MTIIYNINLRSYYKYLPGALYFRRYYFTEFSEVSSVTLPVDRRIHSSRLDPTTGAVQYYLQTCMRDYDGCTTRKWHDGACVTTLTQRAKVGDIQAPKAGG